MLIKDGSIKDLDPAKLKLSAKNIQFSLADSRTDFIDPNSPKTSCSIDLTVTVPSDLIKKSDEARSKVDALSVEAQANNLGVNYEKKKKKKKISSLNKSQLRLAFLLNFNNPQIENRRRDSTFR